MRLSRTSPFPLLFLAATIASAQGQDEIVARGAYLAEGIPNTGMKYAGAFVIEEPGLNAYASNITMDVETGIGSWSDEEIIRGIRDGIRPDGTLIGPPMPSPFFRDMSDSDARAVVAYMRTLEPISNVVPASEYTIPLPPAYGPPVGEVADVSRDDPLTYGTYLAVTMGHCIECHTPMVEGMHDFTRTNEGGRPFPNLFGLGATVVSRNITPHTELGVGEWTDAELKRAITQGISRDGREHLPGMGYPYYATMTDEDLDAIIVYLRSVPPSPPN